ncbi:MAG: phosphopantetheine-binding protein [Methylococcales bacterium]|nr:phosphopantetheine-binding protein [Methylococcales bacterium]
MTMNTDVLDRVLNLLANTLNVNVNTVDQSSSADTLDAWDSLAQVNLMMALEHEFDLQLEVEDFIKLNSVATIVEFIDQTLNA